MSRPTDVPAEPVASAFEWRGFACVIYGTEETGLRGEVWRNGARVYDQPVQSWYSLFNAEQHFRYYIDQQEGLT